MKNLIFVDVDIQADFCEPNGALAVAGSPNDLYRRLTDWAVRFGLPILGSVDSHSYDAWEFASNQVPAPSGEKPNFPDHCVKGTPGWLKVQGTLPQRFRFVPNHAGVAVEPLVSELLSGATQGLYFEKEVYSLFANPNAEALLAQLTAARAYRFVVYGVATDYCVRAAALGLAERGYEVTVLTDGIRAITAEGERRALAAMQEAGCLLTTSAELGVAV